MLHPLQQVVGGDGPALELVEVELLDFLRALGHLDGFHEDGIGDRAWDLVVRHFVCICDVSCDDEMMGSC